MKIDLHIHTTVSDGTLSPEEIVVLGKKQGFEMLAITDHDNIDGVEKATKIGHKLGVKIIPGVELSTQWEGKIGLHLLGYGIDIEDETLCRTLKEMREKRVERAKKMVEKLKNLNFKISFSALVKIARDSIGKSHFADQVFAIKENWIKLKKEDRSRDAFIKKYLNRGGLAYVEKGKIESTAGIDLIHQAGGLAVWAHPVFCQPDRKKLVLMAKKLKEAGLDGIEVFYRNHNKDDVKLLLQLVQELDLFITQGSDFHIPKENKLGGFDFFGYPKDLPILSAFNLSD